MMSYAYDLLTSMHTTCLATQGQSQWYTQQTHNGRVALASRSPLVSWQMKRAAGLTILSCLQVGDVVVAVHGALVGGGVVAAAMSRPYVRLKVQECAGMGAAGRRCLREQVLCRQTFILSRVLLKFISTVVGRRGFTTSRCRGESICSGAVIAVFPSSHWLNHRDGLLSTAETENVDRLAGG